PIRSLIRSPSQEIPGSASSFHCVLCRYANSFIPNTLDGSELETTMAVRSRTPISCALRPDANRSGVRAFVGALGARALRGSSLSVFVVVVAGCGGPQSALEPAGRVAERVADLFWVMAVGAALIWVGVSGLAVHSLYVKPHAHDRRA